jgi:hypothetical protein
MNKFIKIGLFTHHSVVPLSPVMITPRLVLNGILYSEKFIVTREGPLMRVGDE